MVLCCRVTARLQPNLNTIGLCLGSGAALISGNRHCRRRSRLAKGLIVWAMLLGGAGPAAAQYALSPLPRVPTACQIELAKLAQFQPLPPIAAAGDCTAADAVLLQGVILLDKTKVAVVPPATLRCTMADQVARWVREDVALASKLIEGVTLRRIDNLDFVRMPHPKPNTRCPDERAWPRQRIRCRRLQSIGWASACLNGRQGRKSLA